LRKNNRRRLSSLHLGREERGRLLGPKQVWGRGEENTQLIRRVGEKKGILLEDGRKRGDPLSHRGK